MTDHPITPPPELVEQWQALPRSLSLHDRTASYEAAYRAGADAELEACYDAVYIYEPIRGGTADWLRSARRPKPPSPKEKALKVLETLIEWQRIYDSEYQALRHALEQLPND